MTSYTSVDDYLKRMRDKTRAIIDEVQGATSLAEIRVPREILDAFFLESPMEVTEIDVRVGDSMYARDAVVQAFSNGEHKGLLSRPGEKVMLPSTRYERVTGQEKLAVDVALLLPHVLPDDVVVVAGSYSENRGGGSYKMFAGKVSEVHLYDPLEKEAHYIYGGAGVKTRFVHHAAALSTSQEVKCDVFLNDAYTLQDKESYQSVNIPFKARVYSLKRFAGEENFVPTSYRYNQIKRTRHGEWREVSHQRRPGLYKHGGGSCPMCREMSYFYEGDIEELMEFFPMFHGETRECSQSLVPRMLDSCYASPELGAMTHSLVYVHDPSGYYATHTREILKDSGRRVNLDKIVARAQDGNSHYLYSHYKEFEIYDQPFMKVFTTAKIGRTLSRFVPIHLRMSPAFVFEDLLVVGTRVYHMQIEEKAPKQHTQPGVRVDPIETLEISRLMFVEFDRPRSFKFKRIVISYRDNFVAKFADWRELQQFVARNVRGQSVLREHATSKIRLTSRVD